MSTSMGLRDIRKWAQEEMAAAVVAKAKEILDPDSAERLDFDERVQVEKQRDRVLRFLNQKVGGDEQEQGADHGRG